MPKFFICYRREDAPYAAWAIFRRLETEYGDGSVVFDVDAVPLSVDFRDYLDEQVLGSDIFLALIGTRWLEALNNRLQRPNDFVRREIEAALARDMPIVPVLLEGASMPNESSLPSTLANLAYKNAAEVGAGASHEADLEGLVAGLQRLVEILGEADQGTQGKAVAGWDERTAEAQKAGRAAPPKPTRKEVWELDLDRLVAHFGSTEEAEVAHQIAFRQGDLSAAVNLGQMLARESRFDEAEAIWRSAIDLGSADAAHNLATMFLGLEQPGRAEKAYLQALELGDREANYNLGALFEAAENWTEAERYYRRALSKDADQRAPNNLAITLLRQGRPDEAEKYFRLGSETGDDLARENLRMLLDGKTSSPEA